MSANDELQQALAVLVKQITTTGDFVVSQLPAALLETLAYARLVNSLVFVGTLLVIAGMIAATAWLWKTQRKVPYSLNNMTQEISFIAVLVAIVSTLIVIFIAINTVIPDFIRVWYPKAWMLDYLRTFR